MLFRSGDLCVVSYWIDTLVLKTEGNTYATLLHHPFLFKGKTNASSRGSKEERLVEHAKSLTAAMAVAHAASEARNQEIYEENHRFERGRLERQRAFEVSVAKGAAAPGTVLQLSSSSVGSSSSASY